MKIRALLVDIKTSTFQVLIHRSYIPIQAPKKVTNLPLHSVSTQPPSGRRRLLCVHPPRSGWISQEENQKMKNKTKAFHIAYRQMLGRWRCIVTKN
jgi:hypothetical protein